MFSPYLFPLFWAAVLAGIFYPLYTKILRKTKSKNLSAFLTVLIVLLIIILPLVVISNIMVNEATAIYSTFNNQDTISEIKNLADQASKLPFVQKFTENIEVEKDLKNISTAISTNLLTWLKAWTQNIVILIINLFVSLYALYYFLKDGKRFLLYLIRLFPLDDNIEKSLYHKLASTIRATLKGTIFIGFIQGILSGLTIFIVGIPSVLLWTMAMVVLSIIPAVGPLIILLPITAYMVFFGSQWQVIVLVLGMIIVSLSDNFLRPVLVGKDLKMHPLIVFLSTVGGLGLFGISGVVIGPIIASLFISTLDIFEKM